MKIIGVLVVYWPEYRYKAELDFKALLYRTGLKFECIVINNGPQYRVEHLSGSNTNQEFSAWDEALHSVEYSAGDVLVFANDTFSTKNRWDKLVEKKYCNAIISLYEGEYEVFGEVHKYSEDLEVNGVSTNKWIRTHLFGIEASSFIKMGGYLSLSNQYLNTAVSINSDGELVWSSDINDSLKSKIKQWIFPENSNYGWYRSLSCDNPCKIKKIRTILNEKWISGCIFTNEFKVIDCSVGLISKTVSRMKQYFDQIMNKK